MNAVWASINGIHAVNQRYEARVGFRINGMNAVWHEPGHEPGFATQTFQLSVQGAL